MAPSAPIADLVNRLKELGIPEKSARYALQVRSAKAREQGDSAAGMNRVVRKKIFSGNAGRDEASDLIMGALNGSTKKTSISSDKKPAAGAIGMLGLRAAAAASGSAPAVAEAKPIHKSQPVGGNKVSTGRRSPSPFFRARRSRDDARKRDTSPEVGALSKDKEAESDGESVKAPMQPFRPQASAYETDDSGSEDEHDTAALTDGEEDDAEEEELWNEDGEFFDEETSKNTTANAVYFEGDASGVGGGGPAPGEKAAGAGTGEVGVVDTLDNYGEETEQDLLGEGPNVVVPPQPLFQSTYFQQPAKKETTKSGLSLETSRPIYARDRCTITLTHGSPDDALEESGKRLRRYVVLSDLSEESRYAVEWAVGTVARDGDELFLISVKEDESKVDPKSWSESDRAQKLRVQKERQTTCLLLTRQVTGLLQRTRLNITVTCQFLHAKNSRHMLLDLIDFLEPTMCIVGSRGLGKLKGILLGSTSHYLVQKSSVPIMVARRRLQRPLRRTNPADLRHAARTSLAAASIEKTASSKQEDEIVDVADTEKDEAGNSPQRKLSAP
ncbi:uncharacterized protein MKK02DRAFT_34309 [Dioszegia hungarica]|uniref:UspA domain-containing protein n=1 Tax=Dioszegia hungarica TaxID=4972 RepID=A0AA38LTL6_9TREE|nr:uncharacterized protein MKK02DRAFT_34309 [Dioszegia hungarica]KAI9634783.1 hypothetical protein MKK02DRAFT_34309 [Dioszegia hungarica]